MRTDPRYSRVRDMLADPEIPRTENGGLQLCHLCQRRCYFDGGYIAMLANDLKNMARFPEARRCQ